MNFLLVAVSQQTGTNTDHSQLGAFLAGAATAIAAVLIPICVQRHQEKRSIRAALAGEVRAILAIVERRDYLAGLERHIASIDAQHNNLFQVRIARDYDIVFRSNCDKIGLLPADLSESVVRFYYLVSSAVEDVRLFNEANVDLKLRLPYRLDTAEGGLFFHQQLLALSRQIVTEGKQKNCGHVLRVAIKWLTNDYAPQLS